MSLFVVESHFLLCPFENKMLEVITQNKDYLEEKVDNPPLSLGILLN